jgi:alpha-mannosidase
LVVGSSHNDIGWAGTPSEIAEHREHAIIDAVIDLLARDPDYAYAVEASLYADEYLARNPARADYVRALVESGRLEWGGTYVQPYEGLYSGEGLLRQVEFGRKSLADRFGIKVRGAWNVDVQGRTRNLAQIYGAAGIDYLVVSRCRPGIYRWEAQDGSRLLVVSLFQGHYGYPFFNTRQLHVSPMEAAGDAKGGFSIAAAAPRLRRVVDQFEPFFAAHSLPRVLLVTVTSDYAVPNQDLAGFIQDWNAHAEAIAQEHGVDARLEFGTAEAYVSLLEREGAIDRIPAIRGEMPNPWLYIHGPGHLKTVDALRRSAAALLTAERLAALPAVFGVGGIGHEEDLLRRAWRDHVYIDHGFGGLHGVGTDEVFRLKEEAALHAGLGAVERRLAELAQALGLGGDRVVVHNPLPRQRSGWVECEIAVDGPLADVIELETPDGQTVTGHVLAQATPHGARRGSATVGFVAPDVPALGYCAMGLRPLPRPAAAPPTPGDSGDLAFSNRHFSALVSRGGLRSLSAAPAARSAGPMDNAFDRPVAETTRYLFGEAILLPSPGIDVGDHEADGLFDYREPRAFQPQPQVLARTGEAGADLTVVFDGPEALRVTATAPLGSARVRNTYTFYRHLPYFDLGVDLIGWAGEHAREVRICFPVTGGPDAARVSHEVPFGHVEVGKDEIEDFGEMRPREVQSWIRAQSSDRELVVSGSPVVWDWADPVDPDGRTVLQAVLLATKRSCHPQGPWYEQTGNHRADFRICPGPAGACDPTAAGWGRELALRARQGAGPRPSAGPLARSGAAWPVPDEPNVWLSSLKPLGPHAVLARYWEVEGRATEIELTHLPPGARLHVSDAFGDNRSPLAGRRVAIPAHGLVTVVVESGPDGWRL